MKKQETKKENLLRRLEENREFFQATRKMAYASFMEELIEYIDEIPSIEEMGSKDGRIVVFIGTGGEMSKGVAQMMSMFYNPEKYDLLAVENIWDEGIPPERPPRGRILVRADGRFPEATGYREDPEDRLLACRRDVSFLAASNSSA